MLAPSWQERLNWELSRLLFPYAHKVDLVHSFERMVSHVISQTLKQQPVLQLAERRKLLPDYRTSEVGVNECCFYSYVDRPRPPFKDNVVEYRKRYKTLNWDTFLTQMDFLAETMEMARDRGIAFVLVSMPITDLNRQLLSPQARDLFQKNLRLLAYAKGAKFLDFDGTGSYKLDEFEDTVHLNSAGGKKLLDTLACLLGNDTSVRGALQRSSGAILENGAVSGRLKGSDIGKAPPRADSTLSKLDRQTSASERLLPGQRPTEAFSRKSGKLNLATRRESYL
jgi:hypothetical protein